MRRQATARHRGANLRARTRAHASLTVPTLHLHDGRAQSRAARPSRLLRPSRTRAYARRGSLEGTPLPFDVMILVGPGRGVSSRLLEYETGSQRGRVASPLATYLVMGPEPARGGDDDEQAARPGDASSPIRAGVRVGGLGHVLA